MTGKKKFRPLDPEEARLLEKAAKEHDDFLTSLTVRAMLLLGLRSKEFTHTVSEWIVRRGGRLMFDLKPYSEIPGMDNGECIQGTGEIGQGNPNGKNLYKRGEPCASCRDTKGDNVYLSKSANASRDWVLNTSPELKQLGEDFEWWFKQNNKIPFGGQGVRDRVRTVAEEAGLGDEDHRGYKQLKNGPVVDINAYDLRHTYGTRLARMEWEPYEIKEQMGHGNLEMPSTYISYAGIRKEQLMDEKWDSTQY